MIAGPLCFGFLLFLRHSEQCPYIATQSCLKSYITVLCFIDWETTTHTHTQKLTLPMLTGEAWSHTWESWLPRLSSFHFSRIFSTIRFRIFNINVFQQQEKSVAARKWTTFSLKLAVHMLKLFLHICTYTWKQTHKDNPCNILCKSRN